MALHVLGLGDFVRISASVMEPEDIMCSYTANVGKGWDMLGKTGASRVDDKQNKQSRLT